MEDSAVVLAAGAVVTDDTGRVLLVLRGRDPERGRWSVPAGKSEPGESLRETVVREVREETGLDVEVGAELWSLRLPAGDGREFEVHDFAAHVVGGRLAAGDDAADVRWFTPAELDGVPLTADLLGYLRRAGVVPG
ncbi:NUDIX hydrolase [Pseudokineococcus sp. 1T1Z-3]|uniref:NUDIX hydrolase n=1 Tax=Pseudokineococcus sp. 1T1Z-3 TaxID=3132745 RepID=UPI0030B53492